MLPHKNSVLMNCCIVTAIVAFSTPVALSAQKSNRKDILEPITSAINAKSAQLDRKIQAKTTEEQKRSPKTVNQPAANSNLPNAKKSQGRNGTKEIQPTAVKKNTLSQHPLKKSRAVYKFEGPLALEFMKQMNIGGNAQSMISYFVFPGKNNAWNLKIDITDGKNSVLTYRVIMDKNANVDKEQIVSTEYVQQSSGSLFEKKKQIPKTNKENLTVSIENQSFLGKSKILRRTRNGKLINELSVSPDEIITTFGQIVAFMGTIKDLPSQGIKVRWVAEGKPLPVLIKKSITPNGYILTMYKAVALADEKEGTRPLLQFYFDKISQEFSFPTKIVMDVNGIDLEIVKK